MVGLLDIDGHNFPNLALMKLSAYHKSLGDTVEWVNYFNHYDVIYRSKVFTFTPDDYSVVNADEIISGGTGYSPHIQLPEQIDATPPDYNLYPNLIHAYGFLTRGCPNHCSWCVVPKKEGDIHAAADIDDILQGRKSAILMDNNVLASEHGRYQIEKIARLRVKIDFNQGLDARLIDDDTARLLSGVRWLSPIRLACDTKSQLPHIEKAVGLLRKHGATPSNYFIYVLVKDIPDALERVRFIKNLKCDPFAQPYIDFSGKNKVTTEQRRFARWVNHKAIFKSVEYENYK